VGGIGLSVASVILRLSDVRAVKGKRLELSTPNLVHVRSAEVKRSRSHGWLVDSTGRDVY